MRFLSSNHFGHDEQVRDVVNWLKTNDETAHERLMREFPDLDRWFHKRSNVHEEYASYVTDWLEDNTDITWWEGEPVIFESTDDEMLGDD